MSAINIINESVPGDALHIGHGTVGAVEAKLDTIDWPLRKYVVVQADPGNSDVVYVGRPGDAVHGWRLAAGQSTEKIPVDNTKYLAVVGGASGQNYNWFGI